MAGLQEAEDARPLAKVMDRGNMNETDKYILIAIKAWVWSGFYGPDE